jgi:cell division protein FtsN
VSAQPAPRGRNGTSGKSSKLTARDYKSTQPRPLDLRRWREFGYGALVGAVLASLAFVYAGAHTHRSAETPDAPRPDPHRTSRSDPDAAGAAGGKPSQKYDFYEMLPNFEVVVPEKDKDVKRDLPAAARIERPGVYVLQAGSYRNQADADRVRAQLAMQGIAAKVQRVAVDTDVWHRVRVGPINNLDELNKVRRQLQAADVDALVIRVGD